MSQVKSTTQQFATSLVAFALTITATYLVLIKDPVNKDKSLVGLELSKDFDAAPAWKISNAAYQPKAQPSLAQIETAQYSVPVPKKALVSDQPPEVDVPDLSEKIDEAIDLLNLGKWREAEKTLLAMLGVFPESEQVLVELAMISIIDRKDPDGGRQYLERAAKVNPYNESIISELLAVYEDTGRLEGGLQFLKSLAAEHAPDNGALEYGIASSLLGLGRSGEAIEYFQISLELDSDRQHIVKNDMIDAYLEIGKFDEALALLDELADQNLPVGEQRALRIKKATATLDSGHKAAALEVIEDWLKENPNDEYMLQILRDFAGS